MLAQQTASLKRCILGNGEALACTDARSDHAVLDFFVSFCIKAKRKNNHLLSASASTTLSCIQHLKQVALSLTYLFDTDINLRSNDSFKLIFINRKLIILICTITVKGINVSIISHSSEQSVILLFTQLRFQILI